MADLVVASLTGLLEDYGLVLLFFLIMLESGGIPLPGETALITISILAERGKFDLWAVIVVASAAAIIGDNGGYWIGRHWGRKLLTRWKRVERFSQRVLPPSERFFKKHGDKTVFIGRFLPVLRFTAAWMAGISHMPWWKFLIWNAAGGIAWATGVALLSFYFGKAVIEAYDRYGLIAVAIAVGIAALVWGAIHFWKRRAFD
jgi:membrane protein DedA with SNARE-associated domain